MEENKIKNTKYLTVLMAVVSVALVVILILYISQRKESKEIIAQLEEYSGIITVKKDSLENELKSIIVQYDSLKSDNDTINEKLNEQQANIKRLLSLRVSDSEKIRKYEKELGTIREVLRSYIVQIDSLNTRNQVLMAENKQLKTRTDNVETENIQLLKEKEELSTIKIEAKSLVAANIETFPLNKRSKEQEKVDKIEKIRVDFMVRKNTLADQGPKMIFLRLVRPDNVVLGSPESGTIMQGEEELPYTAKREIIYENKDLPVSIFWDDNGDLISGNYLLELYAEGKLIGESEFSLK
jgi:hypothetical protein